MEQYDYIDDLCKFLDSSPVNFLAVDTVRRRLDAEGFERLDPREAWEINRGGRYYVTKNDSAIFAFTVGDSDPEDGFRIIAAHSDSPGFRIKPDCEILCDGNIVKLNTEVYGGPILYTWFDRPLSIAGRVMLRGQDPLRPISRLVRFDRPLLTIPHLAIHFNRSVNDGNPLSKQKDMLPVIGRVNAKGDEKGLVRRLVAEELNVDPEIIIDYDLSLFDTTPACITGINGEFVTSGRIDDLSMVHAALTSLLEAGNDRGAIKVMAIFDNEETGSGTKQGAASPVLRNILKRICIIVHDIGRQRTCRPSQLCRKAGSDQSSHTRRRSCHQDKCQLQVHDRCRQRSRVQKHLRHSRHTLPIFRQPQRRGWRIHPRQHIDRTT